MALTQASLSSKIETKIKAVYGMPDDPAMMKKFCDAIAGAVVEEIQQNAVVQVSSITGLVTTGAGIGGVVNGTGSGSCSMIIDENLLEDIEFKVKSSPHGDIERINGIANVKQAMFNRLMTVKGSLAHRPDYGVGVKLYQNSIGSIETQRRLANEIKKQFEKDNRITKVNSVTIKKDENNESLFIVICKYEISGYGQITSDFNVFGDSNL